MAAFNTVRARRLVRCPRCSDAGTINLQFAYGDTWQYQYELGDLLRWGGNDVGIRSESARVLAFPEPCPVCGRDIEGEYVLEIEGGRLAGHRLATARDVEELQGE